MNGIEEPSLGFVLLVIGMVVVAAFFMQKAQEDKTKVGNIMNISTIKDGAIYVTLGIDSCHRINCSNVSYCYECLVKH